ncbi:BatA and WFA domain-containing protein [Algivirga pacifica]|uniref:BatA and WFA domain-containing protein n=2 Tax=Algivirga pacifica TaxID=1162670 RepID=A0ABP9D923_9BACT
MLSRMAFIGLLVIVFARPYIPNEQDIAITDGENYVSIYLDNSFSMENETNGRKLLDEGKSYTEQIISVFPSSTVYQLLDNGFKAQSGFFQEKAKIEEKLVEIDYSNTGRALEDIYNKQLEALRKNSPTQGNQIFWISDFQYATIGQINHIALDTTNRIHLLPVIADSPTNMYIDSVWMQVPFVKERENHVLHVRVANHSIEKSNNKVVKLYIGERQVSSASISVNAGSKKDIELSFAVENAGNHPCRVSIEDYPVSFDNDYHFVVKVAPTINIVLIGSENIAYLNNVYDGESFFKVKSYTAGSVDFSELNRADLIILEGIDRINDALATALSAAADQGVNLAVFPGSNPDINSYTTALGIPIQRKTLPKEVKEESQAKIAVPKSENPFFDGVFEKLQTRMSMPKAMAVIQWNALSDDLLKLQTGDRFLSAIKGRNNRTYLFSAPLNGLFSNFAKHAVFVPVMYKIALNSKVSDEKLGHFFSDDVIPVQLENLNKGEVYKLVKDQYELIPSQQVSSNALLLQVPKSGIEAGNYEIQQASDGKKMGYVALNYDQKESVLESYSNEELKELFKSHKNVQVYDDISTDQFSRLFRDENIAKPLWRYFLIAALIALVFEILLIRFWKTNQISTPERSYSEIEL